MVSPESQSETATYPEGAPEVRQGSTQITHRMKVRHLTGHPAR